jgi:hypothetical protein
MKWDITLLRAGALACLAAVLIACAATVPPAVGVWDITMGTPLGDVSADLSIDRNGNGALMTRDFGTAPLRSVVLTGDSVAFATTNPQGQVMTFSGTVAGDRLVGELRGDNGTFPVRGTRRLR